MSQTSNQKAESPTQMVMTYRDQKDKPHALLFDTDRQAGIDLLVRTVKWASHNGITLTIQPSAH